MSQKIKSIFSAGLPAIVIATFFVAAIIYAWTEPTVSPPGGNVATPLNVGNVAQVKEGSLILNSAGSYAAGLTVNRDFYVLNGNVGIGTTGPNQKLEVNGTAQAATFYASNGISTYDTTVAANTIETGTLCLGNGINCRSSWPGGAERYSYEGGGGSTNSGNWDTLWNYSFTPTSSGDFKVEIWGKMGGANNNCAGGDPMYRIRILLQQGGAPLNVLEQYEERWQYLINCPEPAKVPLHYGKIIHMNTGETQYFRIEGQGWSATYGSQTYLFTTRLFVEKLQ